MAIDPKAMGDDEFARAFQQLTKGEQPTGKKWRPTWNKLEPYTEVDVAREALCTNVDQFLMMQLHGDLQFEGPTIESLLSAGWVYRSYRRNTASRFIVLGATKRCKRLLDRLGSWHRASAGMHATWDATPDVIDGLQLRQARTYQTRLAASDATSKGGEGWPRCYLDLGALYRFLRGIKNSPYTGDDRSFEARLAWLEDHPAEFFIPSDGTEFWEHSGTLAAKGSVTGNYATVTWRGIDGAGNETGRASIYLV